MIRKEHKGIAIEIYTSQADFVRNWPDGFEDEYGEPVVVNPDDVVLELYHHVTGEQEDSGVTGMTWFERYGRGNVISIIKMKPEFDSRELFTIVAHELGHFSTAPELPDAGDDDLHEAHAIFFESFVGDVYDIVTIIEKELR